MSAIGRLSGIALECPDPAANLDAAERAALALGAAKFETQPSPDHARVFADPVGHPFCLCA